MSILERIRRIGIVPVVVLDDAEQAVKTAEALMAAGVDCAEVTFRTAAAEQAIKNIAEVYPEMLLGAGTVLTTEQVDRALSAGAQFIVTPGYNPEIVNYCVEKGVAIVPGCMDTNSIEMALAKGLDTIKFFPAEPSGGVKMIKSLSGPYTGLNFMPTGGITKDNLNEYLSFKKIIACGGSWMVKKDLINSGKFDEIKRLTEEAVKNMLNFRVVHVGINNNEKSDASMQAEFFNKIFGFETAEKSASTFASDSIEICHKTFPGEHGHIAIGTSDCERAMYYLEKKGIEFDLETAKYKQNRLTSIYIKACIGGFAIHLVEK